MKKNLKTEKSNYCEHCNKYIKGGSYKFKSHLYQHDVTKPRFRCSFCPKEYYRKDVYQKHMNTHTGKGKRFICDHCDRSFVDKRNLIVHLKVHDDYGGYYTKNKFDCKACGASYCEQRLLNYHIRRKHFNFQQKETENKNQNKTWIERVKNSEVYVEMTKVNNNVIVIKKCNDTKDIKDKITSDEPKMDFGDVYNNGQSQYSMGICDYCNKEMLKKSLRMHIRERHMKVRKFKCEECNCSFMRHYQKVNHVCGKYKERPTHRFRK